jgi:hypothetical protein
MFNTSAFEHQLILSGLTLKALANGYAAGLLESLVLSKAIFLMDIVSSAV